MPEYVPIRYRIQKLTPCECKTLAKWPKLTQIPMLHALNLGSELSLLFLPITLCSSFPIKIKLETLRVS